MIENYWIKDPTRSEVITKTQIPNKGNFDFFATYFNLMDKKGLSLKINDNPKIEKDKLFTKNGFEYIFLALDGMNEFIVLPSNNLQGLAQKVILEIDNCNSEIDVLNLIIEKM